MRSKAGGKLRRLRGAQMRSSSILILDGVFKVG
jgi:hypothetical protein